MKKVLTLFLAAFMAVACVTFNTSTTVKAGAVISIAGSCGDNLSWKASDTDNDNKYETLTISGSGAMNNYTNGNEPWKALKGEIDTIIIKEGVTSIGDHAFTDCSALEEIAIPASVEEIGEGAFENCSALNTIEFKETSVPQIGDDAFKGLPTDGAVLVPNGSEEAYLTTVRVNDAVIDHGSVAGWCVNHNHYDENGEATDIFKYAVCQDVVNGCQCTTKSN